MSTDSLDHRQRVIFVGLKKMTNDRNIIIDGFRYWMTHHSSKPFDVNSSVASLVKYLGLDSAQKKSLMIGLHVALNKLTDDLPIVPKSLLDHINNHSAVTHSTVENTQKNVSSNSDVRKNSPPHCDVTSAYLQTLTQLLYKNDIEAFNEVKAIIGEDQIQSVTEKFQQEIKTWAHGGFGNLNIDEGISEEDCKNAAHELYLFISEVIGPVEADDLVNAAISQVKKLDACSRFAPHLLL